MVSSSLHPRYASLCDGGSDTEVGTIGPVRGADVVVIGAGVIGLAAAGELRRAGVDSVVVLEGRGGVGQGSSSRANGGVRAQFSTRPNIEFSRYSLTEFERMHAESGGELGFHQVGYLLFTGTADGLCGLRAAHDLQRAMGVDTEWLSTDEVLDRAPFLRPDGLLAGTFHARDGIVDPHGVVAFLAAQARGYGATVVTDAAVRSIRSEGRSEGRSGFRISSDAGDFGCEWVVNAAGPDAASVAAMLSLDLPIQPVRRNLAYVEGPPAHGPDGGLIPMCVDLDTGVLVRREKSGGYVLAYSNPDDPPGRETTVDPDFLPQLAGRIGRRFPFLENVPINPRHCWAGLYPETPDHHAVLGAPPPLPRFVQCAGFGGHGLMHAPAAGRAVAEIVTSGECSTFDLRPLRPTRFAENDLVMESAVF
ncbi:MAG: FAD-dependent oxidoreductase [Streptosporangiales bacterium]|nr:FAD-dependent oxidoreductase [Streptosporangiales bacterium]